MFKNIVIATDGSALSDKVLQPAAALSAGGRFGRVLIGSDDVRKGIIDAAEENGCDLIMMAAHGRRGVAALVPGSETQKVLTHSKIPVLVYR